MKRIIKMFFAIIGISVLWITGLIVKDLIIENKLNKIVKALSYDEKINMNIETSGDYAKVEILIKKDYNDFYELVDKIIYEYGNPIIDNCLSVLNYANDGPNFLKTKQEFEHLKNSRKELNIQMLNIVSSSTIAHKIKEYKLDKYYEDLYMEYVTELRILINDIIKDDTAFNQSIDDVIVVLDFLSEEQEHWTIEGEQILFDDQVLLDKYNWLVKKICIDCNDESLQEI